MLAMITGAAGGLGRALAVECARRGFDLMLTDISQSGLEALSNGIMRRYPVRALARACDLTDPCDLERLFDWIREGGHKLDMLLNVAGVDFEGEFCRLPGEELAKIVRLNVEAAIRTTRLALELRRQEGPFYLVFVSSLASFYPMPLKATYAASKCFLREFACALGEELRPSNVRVLALCPAGLPTTHEAMSGIAAQGFWGEATMGRLEKVARGTISRALKGKALYVPGAVSAALRFAGALLPRRALARLLFARWRKAQQKWLRQEVASGKA